MDIARYFNENEGTGILATADGRGKVDMAVYEKPEVIDNDTIALRMLERRSYQNITTNPHAAYTFIEAAGNYQGRRFYLKMIDDKSGEERVRELKAQNLPLTDPALAGKHFVTFKIVEMRPLVGDAY